MKIDELLENPESWSKTYRKLLGDVNFKIVGAYLQASCRSNLEVQLITTVVDRQLKEGARKELGIQAVEAALDGNRTEKAHRPNVGTGIIVSKRETMHPEYVLGNFLADRTNATAFAAVVALVDSRRNYPGKAEFLYLHGSKGCGKTHLLNAAVNGLAEAGKRTLVFEGRDFARYVLTGASLTGPKREAHFGQLHEADGLAVDDLESVITGETRIVQQQLRLILESLEQEGKYGIFTGRYDLKDWRLKSDGSLLERLARVQPAEIRPPDRSMRFRLAEMAFEATNVRLEPDIVSFVTDAQITDMRTLLALCYELVADAYEGREITVKSSRSLLKKLGVYKGGGDDKVVSNALEAMGYGIQLSEMKGPKINRELKELRNNAILGLVADKRLPQGMVARAFGISAQAVSKILKKIQGK